MSQQTAVVVFGVLIAALLWRDAKSRPSVSSASWLVLMWAIIVGSRPVSMWFGSGVSANPEAYLEGSPTDRAAYLALILAGLTVLLLRRASLVAAIRRNPWIVVFYGYCAVSILWSDYPFVAFKRWFKDFGTLVMTLVLLTEREPVEAIKAVFVRCAYILVPASVMFIKYYPDVGRTYVGYNQNELMYVGVTANKNALGAMLIVSIVFLVSEFIGKRVRASVAFMSKSSRLDVVVTLAMSLWLLLIANSATAIVCTSIGVLIVLGARVPVFRRQLRVAEFYAIAGVVAWALLDSLFHITQSFIESLGRDMTLTSRTVIWDLVLSQNVNVNPLVGAGFSSFWMGERMAKLWVELPGIVQAHNGYLQAYLDGGIIGVTLLLVMLFAGFRKVKDAVLAGDAFGPIRLGFLLIVLFYNWSEAAFSQPSPIWLITLIVIAGSVRMCGATLMTERAELSSPVRQMRSHPTRPRPAIPVGANLQHVHPSRDHRR
jgi:O-antigen ligase